MNTVAASQSDREEKVISAASGSLRQYLRDQYDYRLLLIFLIAKDIKVLLAQTVIGVGWILLRPLLSVLLMTLIFGMVVRIPSDGAPYLLFALSGMLPWSYFSGTIGKASGSLVNNSGLITKIYFPRTYMPLSVILGGLIELAATFTIFMVVAVMFYDHYPDHQIFWLPIPLILLLLTTTGVSLWLSALAVDFKDVRLASQYLIQLLMFAAPVVWPVSLLSKRLGSASDTVLEWYSFYPLVGIIEGFRGALLNSSEIEWAYVYKGFATSIFLLVSGFLYFRRRERLLADYV